MEMTTLAQVLLDIVVKLEQKHVNLIHVVQATNVVLNYVQEQVGDVIIITQVVFLAICGVAQLFLQKLLVLMDMITIVMER
jgi:hypothetical protein